MANISSWQEEQWLQAAFKDVPAYCGIVSDLAMDDDLEAGVLTDEITGYTGSRKQITFGDITQVGGKGTIKNTVAVEFESMPAPEDRKVKYAIVCDAATGGHIRYWCPLVEEKTWNEGDTFRIPIDGLVLDLA